MAENETTDSDQSWYRTKEWQEAERQADEDIAAGRVREFDDVEDLIEEFSQDRG